jgi:heat shock protein HslJ
VIRAAAVLLAGATMATANPSADMAATWRLVALNGQPVAARVTLDLAVPGQVSGMAPCNRYSGRLDGIPPAFRPGPLRATKRACGDLALETAFFRALGAVRQAMTVQDRLLLTGDGVRLDFRRAAE